MSPPSPSMTRAHRDGSPCPNWRRSPRRPLSSPTTRRSFVPIRRPDFNRRVAVTGLGVISPVGQDVDSVWSNLVAGNSGLSRITRFDPSPYEAQVAGEVNDFEPGRWMDFKAARRTDRNVVLGVAAAKQALEDSGLAVTPENRDDIGIIFGCGGGGPNLYLENKATWESKGARAVSPF